MSSPLWTPLATLLTLTVATVRAAVWLPGSNIVATASSQYNAQRAPRYAVDGSGLSGECHSAATADGTNWMASGMAGQWIKLDLGELRELDSLRVWNFNWKPDATHDYTGRGVQQADLYVSAASTDPGSTFPGAWTLAVADHLFAQASGLSSYTGAPPVSLAGHRARWLALRVDSSFGTEAYVGLSELRVYLADPLPTLTVGDAEVLEGAEGTNSELVFPLVLSQPMESELAVTYATSNETATAGVDYVAAEGTVVFAAGSTQAVVTVTVLGDALYEPHESLRLWLVLPESLHPPSLSAVGRVLGDDPPPPGTGILLEAETFNSAGGWKLDGQFIETMGSPFLLAHGMGKPVADATATFEANGPAAFRLWVRTRDWCPDHADAPGQFQVLVDGLPAPTVFGTNANGWAWQDGGMVAATGAVCTVALHDLTGYDGRCDAVYLASDPVETPPDDGDDLRGWRRDLLGLADAPPDGGSYDVVVVGGGIAGCAAAIAAARSGISVALVQDRPVLGGNASQEVRVHTMGTRVSGSIVDEIDTPNYANGDPQAIVYDALRQAVVAAEPNIALFMGWRAFAAETNGNRIASVDIRDQRSNEERRLHAPLFIDCTGDGWLGFWAGADSRMGREARSEHAESLAPVTGDAMTMGSTLQWRTRNTGAPVVMAPVPWATAVAGTHVATSGDWDWEYGLHLNTIYDAEEIRDHLLRAIYGSFYNAKQNVANANRDFEWVAYVAGKRESRRLLGDHILTEQDVKTGVFFPDAVAQGSWSIDLHYARTNPHFMTTATQIGVSPYWFPFRCLYSRNIENLMMAGRNLSATHVGLGSPRVMNTCGQMGVAVGYAAALCTQYGIMPRDVYESHIAELQAMIGGTPEEPPVGPPADEEPELVLDDASAEGVVRVGTWTTSTSEPGYYGTGYLHDGNTDKGAKSVRFRPTLPRSGDYRVYARWTAGTTRATNAPIDVVHADGSATVSVNQRLNGNQWILLGTRRFTAGTTGSVIVRNAVDDGGHVIADAVGFAEVNLDRDGDGLPDWWEYRYFGNITNAVATADGDGDHSSNLAECRSGCDPTNHLSRFEVQPSTFAAPDVFELAWPSASNRTYAVEATTNLLQPFTTVYSNILATPPGNVLGVPINTSQPRFFRIRAE